jgi:hypothetical protein
LYSCWYQKDCSRLALPQLTRKAVRLAVTVVVLVALNVQDFQSAKKPLGLRALTLAQFVNCALCMGSWALPTSNTAGQWVFGAKIITQNWCEILDNP